MPYASAGTLSSNDCLITVEPADSLVITIESIVFDAFGDQIERVIQDVCKQLKIKKMKVLVQDKGALDYTIKARLITAIHRLEGKV
ncbi:MAG TPA: citrate lyase acyl carrier protein [Acholeplasmataceae bacterium]|jgi:citrate lyase subunit gamma (acyl carrier protein)|nr:citrate lyase acyl carrier protein [Acholeplasmataceae bacterium]